MDISVIVPFYKGNQYMQQLFGVVRRNVQNAPSLQVELLLVNDSPDCPIEYDPAWVEGFSVQVLNNPQNMGIHGSRINGIRAARGEFIQMLDQDDLLTDNAFSSHIRFRQEGDVIVGNGINENAATKKPIFQSLAHQKQTPNPRFYYSVGCLIVSPGQCLLRKSAIPARWLEKPMQCNGADDMYLWLLLQGTCRWVMNPDVVYTHVDTGVNLSLDLDKMERSAREAMDLLKETDQLPRKYERIALRRFRMRQFYEGRARWRKAAACLLYPDLFAELLIYTCLKKLCR